MLEVSSLLVPGGHLGGDGVAVIVAAAVALVAMAT